MTRLASCERRANCYSNELGALIVYLKLRREREVKGSGEAAPSKMKRSLGR
jgi:hypothetical protein